MTGSIIYVSSNRETPEFEAKIIKDLLSKSNGLPIVSVTHKPVDLGFNICVGDVGTSGYNFCRQVLMACENSDSDYVISAESDCLYSPDYFTFVPPRLDVPYRNTNIYVQGRPYGTFYRKKGSTFSQVVNRQFYIDRLKGLFGNAPQWDTTLKNWPKEWGKKLFNEFEYFKTDYPCLSFKTGLGMRSHSPHGETRWHKLPYWGDTLELIQKYETK